MNDVTRWLQDLGLAEYAAAFAAQQVDFDLLADLDDDDLKQLGVTALGHRKRLLKAIAALSSGAGVAGVATEPATTVPLPPTLSLGRYRRSSSG